MARALSAVLDPGSLTVVVNVGDDDVIHGAHVAADLDTVMYTLAGVEGPHGWGRADDSWTVMDEASRLGVDTSFRLGDADLANCLIRTDLLRSGEPLSTITRRLCDAHGVVPMVTPASDDRVPTRIQIEDGSWLEFQDYFVRRHHRDRVHAVDYEGAESATPAPGVIDAIEAADLVVIAPSNPPLSVWPILAIPGIRPAVAAARRVVAVSPLFGGRALKGPAADVMDALGLAPGNAGVLEAYAGLLSDLIVDRSDVDDVRTLDAADVRVTPLDTRIGDVAAGTAFGRAFLELFTTSHSR